MSGPLRRVLSIEQRRSLALHQIASTIYQIKPSCAWVTCLDNLFFGSTWRLFCRCLSRQRLFIALIKCHTTKLMPPLLIVVVIRLKTHKYFSYLFESNQNLATGGLKLRLCTVHHCASGTRGNVIMFRIKDNRAKPDFKKDI